MAAGLAALAGHSWSFWLGGKGGKAVATGLGMLLGLVPAVGLACFGIFLTTLSASRIVSLSSVVAALSLPLLMLGWAPRPPWNRNQSSSRPAVGASRLRRRFQGSA